MLVAVATFLGSLNMHLEFPSKLVAFLLASALTSQGVVYRLYSSAAARLRSSCTDKMADAETSSLLHVCFKSHRLLDT